MKHLHVDRVDTMMDEDIVIRATGLDKAELYKFLMRLRHKTGVHEAYAVFRPDDNGEIDLRTAKPIRGTYDEPCGMGLFMSQTATADFRRGNVVIASPPPIPFLYELMLLDRGGVLLDSVSITKRWKHPAVEETEIENDTFCGTLFKPPGNGPFPAIIDMGGTGGGIRTHKGSMLASKGFVAFCLPYFRYRNLVATLEEVDMEYFMKVADWLLSLPYTTDVVGVQGNSFGAAIACLMAERHPQVRAISCTNGAHAQNTYACIRENGELMPHAEEDLSLMYDVNGVMCYDRVIRHLRICPEAEVRIENARHCAFRFIASMDDLSTASLTALRYLENRVKNSKHYCEVDIQPGGHLMEPPYLPHMPFVYTGFVQSEMNYGGDVYEHGRSQVGVFRRTIAFFRSNLGDTKDLPDWNENRAGL